MQQWSRRRQTEIDFSNNTLIMTNFRVLQSTIGGEILRKCSRQDKIHKNLSQASIGSIIKTKSLSVFECNSKNSEYFLAGHN